MEDVPGWIVGHRLAYWPVVDRLLIAVIYLTRCGAGICSCLAPEGAINDWNAADRSVPFCNRSTRNAKVTTNNACQRGQTRTADWNWKLINLFNFVRKIPQQTGTWHSYSYLFDFYIAFTIAFSKSQDKLTSLKNVMFLGIFWCFRQLQAYFIFALKIVFYYHWTGPGSLLWGPIPGVRLTCWCW